VSTQNARTVRRWVEQMWNQRRYELCDELIAAQFTEHAHAPFSEHEPGQVDGPATMRASMEWLIAQFPDLEMTIESLVADGALVAVRVRTTGTNLGPLNGVMPPTGRAFRAEQSHWFRLEDARIVEHWPPVTTSPRCSSRARSPGPGQELRSPTRLPEYRSQPGTVQNAPQSGLTCPTSPPVDLPDCCVVRET
jgi:predicted ester cyclase